MKLISEDDLMKIMSGDNTPLTDIFRECYQSTLRSIMSAMRCQKVDAEDVFMDSIVTLRDAIVNDDYRNENVGGYLTRVAINKLKNKNKKDYRMEFLEEQSLLLKSNESHLDIYSGISKVDNILSSIAKLTGKCKSLLQRNLVDGASLTVLVSELGYNSYDVVKTSKARCMTKLREILKEEQKISRDGN